jgi:hypothetical protein
MLSKRKPETLQRELRAMQNKMPVLPGEAKVLQ